MRCPACPDTDLVIADRQGIEIDHCPRCRGIWLDRGELDRLAERLAALIPPAAPAAAAGHHHRSSDSSGRLQAVDGRRRPWWANLLD